VVQQLSRKFAVGAGRSRKEDVKRGAESIHIELRKIHE
jgi:hypothetical protein